jgi:transposase InsO family protein
LCLAAKVSRAGYYKWLRIADQKPKDYDDYLLIKEIFENGKSKCKWGWRSVEMHLSQDKGIKMNHKKIVRIKRKYNLITKIRRRNPYKTIMKKTKEHRTFENILNRKFNQNIPYKIFCTDITYLFFNNRVAYLSVIKDIASGEIVGWDLAQHLHLDIVFNTLENMKNSQNADFYKDALIHSDQGFHYTSPGFSSKARNMGLIQSMSRKGNCIDNAPMESFFGHFKDEVDYKSCKTFEELQKLTADYISYYNNKRYQWDLQKMTPVQYRNHLLSAAG